MLQKEPKGRDVNDSDTFVFNGDFTAKLYRIKINSIQLKETTEENEKTHEAVFRDRQYQVRARVCVVTCVYACACCMLCSTFCFCAQLLCCAVLV